MAATVVTRRLVGVMCAATVVAALMAAPTPASGDSAAAPSSAASSTAAWRPDVAAAKRYARQRPGRVGFVLRDGDGDGHVVASLRPHRTVYSASIIKSIFVTAFVNRRSVRDRPLRRWERQLLRPMIVRSDDGAATTVRDLLGTRRVLALARRAGMTDFRYNPYRWGLSRISPDDMSRYFLRLPGLLTPRHRDWVMRLFHDITPRQRWGVPPATPTGWRWYLKGGWIDGIVNQVALLESGRTRLSLAVLIVGTPGSEELVQRHPGRAPGTHTITGVTRRLLAGL